VEVSVDSRKLSFLPVVDRAAEGSVAWMGAIHANKDGRRITGVPTLATGDGPNTGTG